MEGGAPTDAHSFRKSERRPPTTGYVDGGTKREFVLESVSNTVSVSDDPRGGRGRGDGGGGEYSHFRPPPLPLEKRPEAFPFESLDAEVEEAVAEEEAPPRRENDDAGRLKPRVAGA